jgi:L-cysteine/cystine lyase
MVRADPKIDAIRQAMPATLEQAYLNTGTTGPIPRACVEVLQEETRSEFERGRGGIQGFLDFRDKTEAFRERMARLYNCSPNEVSFTHHTTEGMNFALWGLDWHEGDEAITTSVEHIGGLGPLYVLQGRRGITTTVVDCGPTGEGALDAIGAALSRRTKAVVLSHVAYSTGYVLPLAEIARRAHEVGAVVIVDGAQSTGAIPLDMRALGVDAYSSPGQKWLCGPEGTGALFVSEAAAEKFGASFAGGHTFEHFDELGGFALHADGRRFETGTTYRPGMLGLAASVQWLQDEVSLDWATERIATLAQYLRDALRRVEGVDVLTPPGRQAGLTTFTFPEWEPMAVVEELADRGIVIRSIGRPACLRVSTGFYNTEDEIDRLVDALREVQALAPRPPRITFH